MHLQLFNGGPERADPMYWKKIAVSIFNDIKSMKGVHPFFSSNPVPF